MTDNASISEARSLVEQAARLLQAARPDANDDAVDPLWFFTSDTIQGVAVVALKLAQDGLTPSELAAAVNVGRGFTGTKWEVKPEKVAEIVDARLCRPWGQSRPALVKRDADGRYRLIAVSGEPSFPFRRLVSLVRELEEKREPGTGSGSGSQNAPPPPAVETTSAPTSDDGTREPERRTGRSPEEEKVRTLIASDDPVLARGLDLLIERDWSKAEFAAALGLKSASGVVRRLRAVARAALLDPDLVAGETRVTIDGGRTRLLTSRLRWKQS